MKCATFTTKWDKPAEFAQKHEEELVNKFWANMIKLGCPRPLRLGAMVDRSSSILDPVSDIITPVLRFKPIWLQIQRELGKGSDLSATAVGKYVDRKLTAAIAECKESSEAALVQARESHQEAVKNALSEQAEDHQRELKKAEHDQVALREDFGKVMKAEEERRSKLFGFDVLRRLNDYIGELDNDDHKIQLYSIGIPTLGLFEVCKYIWKKQGVGKDQIKLAENKLGSLV